MNKEIIIASILIFLVNVLSNSIGTLKTIFIAKKFKQVYFVTFLDSLIFIITMKLSLSNNNMLSFIAFALGKTVGAILANIIEERIALGIYEVTIYANKDTAIPIADELRDNGYSVTNIKGFGMNGNERFLIQITIERKDLNKIKNYLEKYNYSDATMTIKELDKIGGKLIKRISKNKK